MTRRRWMLLLFAIILTLFALKAFAFTVVEVKEAAFSYRPEVESYYLQELAKANQEQYGAVSPLKQEELYHKLESTLGTDMDFDLWSPHGGVSPQQFRVRVRVKNYGDEASMETPITIKIDAKVGDYQVDPDSQIVNQEHLQRTAQWVPIQTLKGEVPVLAPNQSHNYFSDPIAFGAYTRSLANQYPVALRASIALKNQKPLKTVELPINPVQTMLETQF